MRFATVTTLAALTMCACGESFSPTQGNDVGTYSATRLEAVAMVRMLQVPATSASARAGGAQPVGCVTARSVGTA